MNEERENKVVGLLGYNRSMRLSHTQTLQGRTRCLILPEDPHAANPEAGLIATLDPPAVQRVKNVPQLLRRERWQPAGPDSPTLDDLTARVPALRPFRGIQIRLRGSETAWLRFGRWTGGSEAALARLTAATAALTIPAHEPDGDYFLASETVRLLGGEVLDPPRAFAPAPAEAY